MNKKKNKLVAIISIPTGIVMMLCLGLMYAWSIFVVPLEQDLACGRDDISLVFTVTLLCFCMGSLIVGQLLSRGLKFQHALLLAGALLSLGFLSASFAAEVWQVYVTYGVCGGMAIGGAYTAIISTIVNWFPEKKGLVSGLLMMGYGLGPLVLGVACNAIIDAFDWRLLFKIIALTFSIVFLGGTALLNKAHKHIYSDPSEISKVTAQMQEAVEGYSLSQMIRRPEFIFFYIWAIFYGMCCLIFIGNIAPTALELGIDSTTAAFLVGMVSLFNGCGRVLMGIGLDKLGYRKMIVILSVFFSMTLTLLYVSTVIYNFVFFTVMCAAMGLCFSGLPTSASVFVMQRFGQRYYSEKFSGFNTSMIPQSLLGTALFAKKVVILGSYSASYRLLLPNIIAILICCFVFKRVLGRNEDVIS